MVSHRFYFGGACCICGKELDDVDRHDPYPFVIGEHNPCCGECHRKYVMPTRRALDYHDRSLLERVRQSAAGKNLNSGFMRGLDGLLRSVWLR